MKDEADRAKIDELEIISQDDAELNDVELIDTTPRWLKLVQTHDAENLRDYDISEELSNNGISIVSRGRDGKIYKRSIPFLVENELYCLLKLYYGSWVNKDCFVPHAERFDKYTIRMEDLGISEMITDVEEFMLYKRPLEQALNEAVIRHGDITTQAIIVRKNKPYLIDFAEARLENDPRPDKRPQGDAYWLDRTFFELCLKVHRTDE